MGRASAGKDGLSNGNCDPQKQCVICVHDLGGEIGQPCLCGVGGAFRNGSRRGLASTILMATM
jgi:hypothetical protein